MTMDLAPSDPIGYGARLRQHYEDVDKRLRPSPPKRAIKIPQAKPPAPPKPPQGHVAPAPRSPAERWKTVLAEVCTKHRINLAILCGRRRDRTATEARHEAFCRLHEELGMSLTRIGARMGGFDHTTVLAGIRRHKQRMNGIETRPRRGVYRTKSGTWRAEIKRDGMCHYIGTFRTMELAEKARRAAEDRHG